MKNSLLYTPYLNAQVTVTFNKEMYRILWRINFFLLFFGENLFDKKVLAESNLNWITYLEYNQAESQGRMSLFCYFFVRSLDKIKKM